MSGDDIGRINTTAAAAAISSQNGHLDWEDMFSKRLKSSDVTKPQKGYTSTNNKISSRLVIPKQQAQRFFGPLQPDAMCEENSGNGSGIGKELEFEDERGQKWTFRYSFWRSSQTYVFTKGWSPYVKEKGLRVGDTVFFKRHRSDSNRLLIERNRSVSQATSSADGERLEGIFNKTEQQSKVHLKRKPDPPTRNGPLVAHNLACKDSENITTVGSPVDQVPEVVPSCNVPVDDPTIPKETIPDGDFLKTEFPVSGANYNDKTKDYGGGDFSNLICSSAGLNFASAGGDFPLFSEAAIHNRADGLIVDPGNAYEPDREALPESNIDALNASPAKHQLSEISPLNLEPNLNLTTPPINSGDEAFTNSNNKSLSKGIDPVAASFLEQQWLEFFSSNYEPNLSSMRSPASFGYEVNINSNNNSFSKDSSATPYLLEIFPPTIQTDLSLNASTNSKDKFFSKGTDPAAASPAKRQRNLGPNLSLATPAVSSADKDSFTSANNNFVANTLLVTDHSMESEPKQRHHELAKSMDSLISSVGDELSSYCEKYKSRDPEFAPQLESRPKVFQNFAIQSVGIIMKIFCQTSVDQSLMEEHRSVIESHWEHLRSSILDLPELGKLVAASSKLTPYEEAHGEVCRAIQSLETIKKDMVSTPCLKVMESTPLPLMDYKSKLQEAGIAIKNGMDRMKRIKPSSWIEAHEH